jgi:hypothetical protein
MDVPESAELGNERLRWPRAATWAGRQSFGPRAQGLDPRECERIKRLAERIERVGEDQAREEYEGEQVLG